MLISHYTIRCDSDACPSSHESSRTDVTAAAARAEARELGWTLKIERRKGSSYQSDLCPKCSALQADPKKRAGDAAASPAFSLLELLVVVAIAAIAASMLAAVVGRARAAARSTACSLKVRDLGFSAVGVCTDRREVIDRAGGFVAELEIPEAGWVCPEQRSARPYPSYSFLGSDYRSQTSPFARNCRPVSGRQAFDAIERSAPLPIVREENALAHGDARRFGWQALWDRSVEPVFGNPQEYAR